MRGGQVPFVLSQVAASFSVASGAVAPALGGTDHGGSGFFDGPFSGYAVETARRQYDLGTISFNETYPNRSTIVFDGPFSTYLTEVQGRQYPLGGAYISEE